MTKLSKLTPPALERPCEGSFQAPDGSESAAIVGPEVVDIMEARERGDSSRVRHGNELCEQTTSQDDVLAYSLDLALVFQDPY
ncbi:hypothetical protein RRG08_049420 [Elysia crispata]|uniref:Uncharacterized protein n=1 Tax=Elysia crispata TaxID=231223 RepID=A0AAE0ZS07_9GAST|nr:hypothetical protein RRG08_049420 [Elysia crispata]